MAAQAPNPRDRAIAYGRLLRLGKHLITERPTRKVTPAELLGITEVGGPLIEGITLMCPACEVRENIMAFIPLEHSTKYVDQIVVPLKCRSCRHVFALRP